MDAHDVIESYVHDVARRLPRATRNDVAFELRALLRDDLRSRAAEQGRPADAELAIEMLRAFGRPGDTAARYHPPFTLVAPGDTWSFLVAAVAGGFVLSVLLYPTADQTYPEASERSSAAFLGWLGLLVLVFSAKSLILHRRPDAFAWKPRRVRQSDRAGWLASGVAAVLWAALLALYLVPGPIVGALSFGRVDAETLRYSDSFAGALRMPWLVVLLLAAVALHLLVAVRGRWENGTRWARILLIAEIAVQFGWHSRYGDVFADRVTDERLLLWLAAASGALLLWAGVLTYRQLSRVEPAPAQAPSGPKTP